MRFLRQVVTFGLVAAASIASVPTASDAQATLPKSVQELVLTPGYQSNVARLFSQLPADVFRRCPGLVSKGSSVTIIEPAIFATDGYPTAGIWMQRFPVSGCGNDTTINLVFKAAPDEKILSIVALPGETHAGVVLQRDTVKYAMLEVEAKSTGCSAFHVRNTRFLAATLGEPRTPALKAMTRPLPWHELWTVSACGQSYDVPMIFTPDATGTTISAGPAELLGH